MGQQPRSNIENLNIINGIFGQGPLQSNIAITPNAVAQSIADSERERRLKLREMERVKRLNGLSNGGSNYGQIEAPQPIIPQGSNIFGSQQHPGTAGGRAYNRRDQMWQQKMMQRVGSHESPRAQPVLASLPINQIPQQMPSQVNIPSMQPPPLPSGDQSMRFSRTKGVIYDAVRLDQSLNNQDYSQETQKASQQKPQIVNQNQKPPSAPSNPLLGNDDDLIKKRRDADKLQRQKDYQEFLSKQGGKPPAIPGTAQASTPRSQREAPIVMSSNQISFATPGGHQPLSGPSHSSHRPSNQLLPTPDHPQPSINQQSSSILQNAGGLNLLGMHQLKKEEDKLKIQREYRQQLDAQAQLRAGPTIEELDRRRKDISDQVFNELLGKQPGGVYNQPQLYIQDQAEQKAMPQQDQQKQAPDLFNKLHQTEDDRKRQEYEKKRQYGLQLQQQMASQEGYKSRGSRRGGSVAQQPHQQQSQVIPEQQQFSQPPQRGGPFENPQYQLPQQYSVNQGQPPQIMMGYGGGFQPQPDQPGQFGQNPQSQFQMPIPQHTYQPVPPLQSNILTQGTQQPVSKADVSSSQLAQKQKQEEYRKFLEQQVKDKEGQKKLKEERDKILDLKDDQPPVKYGPFGQQPEAKPPQIKTNFDPPQYPGQLPQQFNAPNLNYGEPWPPAVHGKITSQSDPQGDAERKSRQQQYQEELKKQMDERNRLKGEEKRRLQEEDQANERKLREQQLVLQQREQQELQKEGRSVKEERKRQVRRDLFEPSSDNPTVVGGPKVPAAKPRDEPPATQQVDNFVPNLWQNPPHIEQRQAPTTTFNSELPINNRREELFQKRGYPSMDQGGAPLQNFGGTQPSFQGFQQQPHSSLLTPPNLYGQQPNSAHSMPSYQSPAYPSQPPQFSGGNNQALEGEYSNIISLYQKAFSEIIEFKNQYVEEVMKMRERVVQEREELLEYEKIKAAQQQEILNLKTVHERLGDMMNEQQRFQGSTSSKGSTNPYLNPAVQLNLNTILQKQQSDIMRLSQNGMKFRPPQMMNPQPLLYQQQLPEVASYQSQQEQMVYAHLKQQEMMRPQQQRVAESKDYLEQSLSSDTKFVVVQNKLATYPQAQNEAAANGGANLMQTWKPEEQQKKQLAQDQFLALQASLQGSSQFITGHQSTTPIKQLQATSKLVPRPQSGLPEVIHEMPSHQEDDSKLDPQQRERAHVTKRVVVKGRSQEEEIDFNSRESSKSPERHHHHPGFHNQYSRPSQLESNSQHILIKHNEQDQKSLVYSMIQQDQQSIIINNPAAQYVQAHQLKTVETDLARDGVDQLEKTEDLREGINEIESIIQQQQAKQQYTGPIPLSLQSRPTSQAVPNRPAQQQPPQQNDVSAEMSAFNIGTPYDPYANNNESMRVGDLMSPTSESVKNANPPSQVKTQLKTQERFNSHAGATGSSFYNATMHLQKQQEKDQQEELQKQLMRIYGTPSINADQLLGGTTSAQPNATKTIDDDAARVKQSAQRPNWQNAQKRANQGNTPGVQHYLPPLNARGSQEEMLELLMQTNINIAESINEETQANLKEQFALINEINQAKSQQAAQQQQAALSKYTSSSRREARHEYRTRDLYQFQTTNNNQQEEPMGEKIQPGVANTHLGESSKFNGTESQEVDIWNDPDLIPPPVVAMEDDEEDELTYKHDSKNENMVSLDPPYYPTHHQPITSSQPFIPVYQMPPAGFSQGNTSMNAGTINQLQMLSPPSHVDDSRINLGTYGQDAFERELEQQKYQVQVAQQAQLRHLESHRQTPSVEDTTSHHMQPRPLGSAKQNPPLALGGLHPNQFEEAPPTDRSLSQKERDIIEIAKLIQKATTTTNTLLENTDHFKFRFKKGGAEDNGIASGAGQVAAPGSALQRPSQLSGQCSRKNLINEGGKQTTVDDQRRQPPPRDSDSHILDNLDKIIQNLQDQKNMMQNSSIQHYQYTQQNQAHEQSIPIAHEPSFNDVQDEDVPLLRKGSTNQVAHGGTSQFSARAQQISIQRPLSSVGQQQPTAQHVKLRPVSGKSNSNRYYEGSRQNASRSKSRDKQPMYYEDDIEEDF